MSLVIPGHFPAKSRADLASIPPHNHFLLGAMRREWGIFS